MSIPMIDFNQLNVVAITRTVSGNCETKINHITNDKYDSFYCTCSNEEHDKLVNYFEKYLSLKYK